MSCQPVIQAADGDRSEQVAEEQGAEQHADLAERGTCLFGEIGQGRPKCGRVHAHRDESGEVARCLCQASRAGVGRGG